MLVGHAAVGCHGVMMSSLKLVWSKKPKIPLSSGAKLRSGALSSHLLPASCGTVWSVMSEGLRSSLKLSSIKKLGSSVVI